MTNQAPSSGTARDALPYFTGRRKELATLRTRLRYIRKTNDPRGGMVLDGVQGVGKTQLVAQFATEAAEDDHRTAVLNVPMADLASPLALFAAIVGALGGNDRIAKEIADAAGGVTSAKIAGVGVSAECPSPLGLSINAMLVRSKRGGLWQGRTLVVAVEPLRGRGLADGDASGKRRQLDAESDEECRIDPHSPPRAEGVRHLAHGIQAAKGCALSGGRQKSS